MLLPLFTIGCMLCLLGWAPAPADAGNVVVTIRFSEAALDTAWFGTTELGNMSFGVNWYTCQTIVGTPECPGGTATFDATNRVDFYRDKVAPDTWRKTLDTGSWVGRVLVNLYVPIAISANTSISPPRPASRIVQRIIQCPSPG
jgi:hypothetical protein